jgi:hypothetical protein
MTYFYLQVIHTYVLYSILTSSVKHLTSLENSTIILKIYVHKLLPNIVVEWSTLLHCIREVPISNLDPYPFF